MKITYIHHSGFLAELNSCYLLFDYIAPPNMSSGAGNGFPALNQDKPVIVMASHRHGDHFSAAIFDIAEIHESTRYLLSYDIKKKNVQEEFLSRTDFIRYDETLSYGAEQGFIEPITVETFKSTDEGVAFLVTVEGKTIYHAGDLNNWTWNGEPDSWNNNMQTNYRREIQKIMGRRIDVAFLPLDPRLQDKFYLGIDDFFKVVGAEVVFPMHLWGDFEAIRRLKDLTCTAKYRDRIIEINHDYESFTI